MKVNRHDVSNAADASIAPHENPAFGRAIADRDHPFRIGRGIVGAEQRLPHVFADGTGHHQHIGMAW